MGSACLLLLLFGVSGWLNLVFLEVGFEVFYVSFFFLCNFSNWVLCSGGFGIWVFVILLNFIFLGVVLNFDSWSLN